MIVKISKAVWAVSLLAAVGVLLFTYAGFPEEIIINENPAGQAQTISRNELFYAALILMTLINVTIFLVNRLISEALFRAWFYGVLITLNLFIVVALEFFNLFNSQERFDYERIGYIIYGSVILIVVWALVWPVGKLIATFLPKQEVIEG